MFSYTFYRLNLTNFWIIFKFRIIKIIQRIRNVKPLVIKFISDKRLFDEIENNLGEYQQKQSATLILIVESKLNNSGEYSSEYLELIRPLCNLFNIHTVETSRVQESKLQLKKELERIIDIRPSAVVISHYSAIRYKPGWFSRYIYKRLSFILPDCKFILIGWDSVNRSWSKEVKKCGYLDSIIFMDNPREINWSLRNQVKVFHSAPNHLQEIKKNLNSVNEIFDVWFVGRITSYRITRAKFIDELNKLKIQKYIRQSDRSHEYLKVNKYYKTLNNSKIGLNFSKSFTGYQMKGRAWDILLSGVCLLEEQNSQISKYFEDGVHYLSFKSPKEMSDKIFFLLKNTSYRKKIAAEGQARAFELINRLAIEKIMKKNILEL